MNSTVIGQWIRPPSSRLPIPIATEAHSDAEAISTPVSIRQKRRACPTAASRAIAGKARIGGSDTAPNPTAATAAKKSVRKNGEQRHSNPFLTIIRVHDNPTAMHTISISADVRRAIPFSTCPSTMSITPLISGTPGIR